MKKKYKNFLQLSILIGSIYFLTQNAAAQTYATPELKAKVEKESVEKEKRSGTIPSKVVGRNAEVVSRNNAEIKTNAAIDNNLKRAPVEMAGPAEKAKIASSGLEGNWILTVSEAGNSATTLGLVEKQKITEKFQDMFPINSKMNISASDFKMTHHKGGLMSGIVRLAGSTLTLRVLDGLCASCPPKDFIYRIQSVSSGKLVLDMLDEDEGSTVYVRLTLTK